MIAQYLPPAHRWNTRNYPCMSVTILPAWQVAAESVPPFQRLGIQNLLSRGSKLCSIWPHANCHTGSFLSSKWICLSVSLFILGPQRNHFVICIESWTRAYILDLPDSKAVNVFLSLCPCNGRLCLSVLPLFQQRLWLMSYRVLQFDLCSFTLVSCDQISTYVA